MILSRSGPLPAAHAKDGDRLVHGQIYVAPRTFRESRLGDPPRWAEVKALRKKIADELSEVATRMGWGKARTVVATSRTFQ